MHRPEKMASTVRTIIGDAIKNRLNDPRISPMTSVTRVAVTGDMQNAKVYVSIYGSPAVVRRSFAGLEHAAGHLQRILAGVLETRQCPHLQFELEETIKRAAETIQVINETAVPDDEQPALPEHPEDTDDRHTDEAV